MALPVREKVAVAEVTFEELRKRIDAIRNCIAKDASPAELSLFAEICVRLQLNPFVGQIYWAEKLHRPIIARDGYMALAKRTPGYLGMQSAAVYPDDEFAVRIEDGVPHWTHVYGRMSKFENPDGAWACVWIEGQTPVFEWCPYVVHVRQNDTWRDNPSQMIRAAAERQALKRVFGDPLTDRRAELSIETIDEQVAVIAESSERAALADSEAVQSRAAAEKTERDELESKIVLTEDALARLGWDHWEVPNRAAASRKLHVGTMRLQDATVGKLHEYLTHLQEVMAEATTPPKTTAADAAREPGADEDEDEEGEDFA